MEMHLPKITIKLQFIFFLIRNSSFINTETSLDFVKSKKYQFRIELRKQKLEKMFLKKRKKFNEKTSHMSIQPLQTKEEQITKEEDTIRN